MAAAYHPEIVAEIEARAARLHAELKAATPEPSPSGKPTALERLAAREAGYRAEREAKEASIVESSPAYLKTLTAIRASFRSEESNPEATALERFAIRATRYAAERKALEARPEIGAQLEALKETPDMTLGELREAVRPSLSLRQAPSFGRDI